MIRLVPRAAIVLPAAFAAFAAVAAPALVNLASPRPVAGGAGGGGAPAAMARAPSVPVSEPVAGAVLATHASPRAAYREATGVRIGNAQQAVEQAAAPQREADVPPLVPEFSLIRQDAGQFPSMVGAVAARIAPGGPLAAGLLGGSNAGALTASIVPANLRGADGLADAVVAPVPEPETWAMLVAGLSFVAWRARRAQGAGRGAADGGRGEQE